MGIGPFLKEALGITPRPGDYSLGEEFIPSQNPDPRVVWKKPPHKATMELTFTPVSVHKRVPLTISRGTARTSVNVWVRISQDGIEGWGEATPFSTGQRGQDGASIQGELAAIAAELRPYHPLERQRLAPVLATLGPASRAALDVALHDWLGKFAGLPLWQLWGLDPGAIGPTAVTIGISSPRDAEARLQQWLTQVPTLQALKLKLGSPAGGAADQAMVTALLSHIPAGCKVSVDANGGWDLATAIALIPWLAERGVTYVEQPLGGEGGEDWRILKERSPLPIFADESCWQATDLPDLATLVDGVNIKLMKCGGLSGAIALIHSARAWGLQIMVGCYSDTALSNTALAHLTPLVDHIDLDSHLNLRDDPFQGATLQGGRLIPPRTPGLGVSRVLEG